MTNIFAKLILLILSVSLIGCNPNTPNENVGIATGAIAGGLLGSLVGGGTGQIVAVGVGAVAGGLIGGSIGQSMDQNDRSRMTYALRSNNRTYWVNERTGRTYMVVPTNRVMVSGYNYCRRYYTVVTISGQKQRVYGTACRMSNGAWQVVR